MHVSFQKIQEALLRYTQLPVSVIDIIVEKTKNWDDKNDPVKRTATIFKQLMLLHLTGQLRRMKVYKNQYGNFEQQISHLVLCKQTRAVFGKQVNDTVHVLTDDDIELCEMLKFKWNVNVCDKCTAKR